MYISIYIHTYIHTCMYICVCVIIVYDSVKAVLGFHILNI